MLENTEITPEEAQKTIPIPEKDDLPQPESSPQGPAEPENGSAFRKAPPRAAERYKEISGKDRSGRTKCELILRHYLHYSDGTTKDIEEVIHIRKPVVNIFSAAGWVNVFLDFGRRTDEDLRLVWNLLSNYMQSKNSVSYLPEEISQGYYIGEDGNENLVYFPMVELALSPLGHEMEYMIHGFRPLLYALVGASPEQDLTVLHLVFKDNLFVVDEQVGDLDLVAIQREAWNDAMIEFYGEFPDESFDE